MKIYQLSFLLLFPFLSCKQTLEFPNASKRPESLQNQKADKTGTAKLVFKSTDDGQTWQDISNGLPENLREDGIKGNSFFANDKGLFLRVGNGLYHSPTNATVPFWTRKIFPDEHNSIVPGKSEIFEYKYWGANLKKIDGTNVWSPIFEIFHEPRIRSAFETSGGTIFIGTNDGIFKTDNSGKKWKHVHAAAFVGNFAESNGVLVATSMKKIIRSTDNGENWVVIVSGDSVAFDVKRIYGGFAAITASSESNARRLRISLDGGKTWQPTDTWRQSKDFTNSIFQTWDDRPRLQAVMASIIQVGENFFCTHPDGIFKSSDKGKTWKMLLPAIENKVLNLCVSGNVIYAITSNRGC